MVINAAVEDLPRDWLRGCPALNLLELSWLRRLRTVTADALHGAPSLDVFRLNACRALRRLPAQLFAKNVNLREADLSNNGLVELPADLFGDHTNGSRKSIHRAFSFFLSELKKILCLCRLLHRRKFTNSRSEGQPPECAARAHAGRRATVENA